MIAFGDRVTLIDDELTCDIDPMKCKIEAFNCENSRMKITISCLIVDCVVAEDNHYHLLIETNRASFV